MACKGKSIVIFSVMVLMVLIPLALYIVAIVAPLFYSSRSKLINKYNKRATIWNEKGIPEFKGASFIASVNGQQTFLSPSTETYGENYPIRDKCDRKGDPKNGCITTGAYHYTTELHYDEKNTVEVVIRNGASGIVIYNSTYRTSRIGGETWEAMGCSSVETCKPICDMYGGEIQEKSRVCMFDTYLNELCYRVIQGSDGNYKIDVPPMWDLYPGTIMPGCDYDLSWNEFYYTPGVRSSVKVTIRNYRDAYIQASSLTTGCSSSHEKETSCFPTSADKDVYLLNFCFYMKLGAIGVCFLEVILVLLGSCIYCCKRCKEKTNSNRMRLMYYSLFINTITKMIQIILSTGSLL